MQTKKLSQKDREFIIRQQREKHEYECRRKQKRANMQKAQSHQNVSANPFRQVHQLPEPLTLPQNFDLHTNYEKVMQAINNFRSNVDNPPNNYRNFSLDFASIEHIGIASALVLAAEVDVWKTKRGRLRSDHKKWQPRIRMLLREMGFFALLKMSPLNRDKSAKMSPSNRDKSAIKPDISFVKFLSAQKADGKKVLQLRKDIENTMVNELSGEYRRAMFTSLAEALANAKQHAYENPEDLRPHEKWWITAAYNRKKRRLTVAIYDRGQTIPVTMSKSGRWEEWQMQSVLLKNHALLIKIAMQASVDAGTQHSTSTRSRTGELYRGKGMRQLLDFLTLEESGKIHIISGSGHCCFTLKNKGLAVEFEKTVDSPMRGTLVEWQIDLSYNDATPYNDAMPQTTGGF